jgi:hypothetical protein
MFLFRFEHALLTCSSAIIRPMRGCSVVTRALSVASGLYDESFKVATDIGFESTLHQFARK